MASLDQQASGPTLPRRSGGDYSPGPMDRPFSKPLILGNAQTVITLASIIEAGMDSEEAAASGLQGSGRGLQEGVKNEWVIMQ